MKHLKKRSQHFLVVDTQKTALTSRVDCEGGFSRSVEVFQFFFQLQPFCVQNVELEEGETR